MFGPWGACAIAHILCAQNQDLRLGPFFQKLWQGPHKDMISAIGFKISVDEGDDLLGAIKRFAVMEEACIRVRRHVIGVDAVMANCDLIAKGGWECVSLIARWADACLGLVKMQVIVEVLEAQPHIETVFVRLRKLGIKVCLFAVLLVVELTIKAQTRRGPQIAQEHSLPPTVMCKDHIGGVAIHLQGFGGSVTGLCAPYFRVQIQQPWMRGLFDVGGNPVRQDGNTVPLRGLFDP